MKLRSDHISAYLSVQHTLDNRDTYGSRHIKVTLKCSWCGGSDNRKNRDKVQLFSAKKKEEITTENVKYV